MYSWNITSSKTVSATRDIIEMFLRVRSLLMEFFWRFYGDNIYWLGLEGVHDGMRSNSSSSLVQARMIGRLI